MECNRCKGKGWISRPTRDLVQEIERKSPDVFGESVWFKETIVTEMGGVDACPDCAARAEAEYQSVKGHPRGELRAIA